MPALGDARSGVPPHRRRTFAMEIAEQLDDFVEANPGRHRRQLDVHDGRRDPRGQLGARPSSWFARRAHRSRVHERAPTGAVRPRAVHRAQSREHLRGDQQSFPQQRRRPVRCRASCSPTCRRAQRGWRVARDWLEQEMRVQVLPDGADYESSVPYHRLVAELFMGGARLGRTAKARRCRRTIAAGCAQMVDVSRRGDASGRSDAAGRRCRRWPAAYLHGLRDDGAAGWPPSARLRRRAMFDEPAWLALGGDDGAWEAAWWGFDADRAWRRACRPRRRRLFPHAGIAVSRRAPAYLLVTNGIVGTNGFGNHKHNDLLSFEYHSRRAVDRRSRQLSSTHPIPTRAICFRSDRRITTRCRSTASSRTRCRPDGCSGCSRRSSRRASRFDDDADRRRVSRAAITATSGSPHRSTTSGRSGSIKNPAALVIVGSAGRHGQRTNCEWHFHLRPA